MALIDSAVSMTVRQSDSVPIASEVAMALANREEATEAGRLPKPAVPGDRIMVYILQNADESPAIPANFIAIAGNIAATPPRKRRNHGKG